MNNRCSQQKVNQDYFQMQLTSRLFSCRSRKLGEVCEAPINAKTYILLNLINASGKIVYYEGLPIVKAT